MDENSSSGSSLDEGGYSSLRSSFATEEGEDGVESIGGASYSTSGCDDIIWINIDLVVSLVETVAALLVLTMGKDEHPYALLLTWLFGSICGYIGAYARARRDGVTIGRCEWFVISWLLLGIVSFCDGQYSCTCGTPKKLYSSCVLFDMCIKLRSLGFVPTGIGEEGLRGGLTFHRPSPDDGCCICLVEYGEDLGDIWKLECSHVFHLGCKEKWLRIKPTCPLCNSLGMHLDEDAGCFIQDWL